MKIDDIKKLHQKKYRAEFGYYLVEGEHLILELEKAADTQPSLQGAQLFVTENYQYWQTRFDKTLVTERQMQQMSDTKSPQGIVAVVPIPRTKNLACTVSSVSPDSNTDRKSRPERAIYLFETQDPGNLGTILRTLAWFGGFRCLLSPNSVDPYNPKVVRASMGAIFHLPLELDVELTDLRQRYARIAYLDMKGEAIGHKSFADFQCFLFGNEARGVPEQARQALNAQGFTIPGTGIVESLNLASAVNICAYQLS
ncbi:RNA methyltransferase [Simiduia litorea]|uniref:TrmH family RNA methyltransferase n=1 Tax=Simiduia litorea TaxID=1435348 RepID=UPI0036F25221